MLARTPFKAAERIRAEAKRLNRARKEALRDRIAAMMREVEPTPFAVEGPCRAGIRSSLCLQGWKWADADMAAAEIVTWALRIVGAARPTWEQGQPEYTQPGAIAVRRDNCIRCNKPLPDGHYKFCCLICAKAWHDHKRQERFADEMAAAARAKAAAWREQLPPRACQCCGGMFKPTPKQKYCSVRCAGKINGGKNDFNRRLTG